jgi:predicted GH43/DUF377 family glycosyl hydrolase
MERGKMKSAAAQIPAVTQIRGLRLGTLVLFSWLAGPWLHAADRPAVLPIKAEVGPPVSQAEMQRVYDEVKTPFKYGIVIDAVENEIVDCPNVFRHDRHWYMVYVANREKIGYETLLARSDDLLHWEKLGKILPFRREGWDAWQADASTALYDYRWENGTHDLGQYEGKYWLSYIGGAAQGYEPDPLAIGLASTKNPTATAAWNRFEGNPILSTAQADVRPYENTTLYKSSIIQIPEDILGWPFVMFYNGKTKIFSHESIGMAVSRDLVNWTRYGAEPVIDNAPGKPAISGDPQLTKIGDLWVMFYFGFRWAPHAFDTFACSRDLVHWTKWSGAQLVTPSEPFDQTFAHKPWLLKENGVVYHFYCAVGDKGRVIALATSKDLHQP